MTLSKVLWDEILSEVELIYVFHLFANLSVRYLRTFLTKYEDWQSMYLVKMQVIMPIQKTFQPIVHGITFSGIYNLDKLRKHCH